jgi:hypothetical protein
MCAARKRSTSVWLTMWVMCHSGTGPSGVCSPAGRQADRQIGGAQPAARASWPLAALDSHVIVQAGGGEATAIAGCRLQAAGCFNQACGLLSAPGAQQHLAGCQIRPPGGAPAGGGAARAAWAAPCSSPGQWEGGVLTAGVAGGQETSSWDGSHTACRPPHPPDPESCLHHFQQVGLGVPCRVGRGRGASRGGGTGVGNVGGRQAGRQAGIVGGLAGSGTAGQAAGEASRQGRQAAAGGAAHLGTTGPRHAAGLPLCARRTPPPLRKARQQTQGAS